MLGIAGLHLELEAVRTLRYATHTVTEQRCFPYRRQE